ncbi:hypothetical protein [Thermomonas sp.]
MSGSTTTYSVVVTNNGPSADWLLLLVMDRLAC